MQDQLRANESKRMKPVASLKHQNELTFTETPCCLCLAAILRFKLQPKHLGTELKKTRHTLKNEEYKQVRDGRNWEEP